MRVTRFRGEGSVRDLVARLYDIDEGGPSQTELGTQLAEANRHLPMRSRSLSTAIPKGTLIAVPDVEDTRPGRTTLALRDAAAKAAQVRATAALERLAQGLAAEDERTRADLGAARATLTSKEFVAAARKDKSIKAGLADAREQIDRQVKGLDTARQSQERILAAARDATGQLSAVLAGRPPKAGSTARPPGQTRPASARSSRSGSDRIDS